MLKKKPGVFPRVLSLLLLRRRLANALRLAELGEAVAVDLPLLGLVEFGVLLFFFVRVEKERRQREREGIKTFAKRHPERGKHIFPKIDRPRSCICFSLSSQPRVPVRFRPRSALKESFLSAMLAMRRLSFCRERPQKEGGELFLSSFSSSTVRDGGRASSLLSLLLSSLSSPVSAFLKKAITYPHLLVPLSSDLLSNFVDHFVCVCLSKG